MVSNVHCSQQCIQDLLLFATTVSNPAEDVNVVAPTKTPTETPTIAIITPATTCAPAVDIAVVTTTTMTSTSGSSTEVDNPCIICQDGTAVGGFSPYADDGDLRTCADLIDEAKLYETGSNDCNGLNIKS